jgi:hypothetical protein
MMLRVLALGVANMPKGYHTVTQESRKERPPKPC